MERQVAVPWSYVRPNEFFHAPKITMDDAASIKWLRGPVASVVARLVDTVGPEQTFKALLSKWRDGNTDGDIIGAIADVVASYADMAEVRQGEENGIQAVRESLRSGS
jgi:hypothetical protein